MVDRIKLPRVKSPDELVRNWNRIAGDLENLADKSSVSDPFFVKRGFCADVPRSTTISGALEIGFESPFEGDGVVVFKTFGITGDVRAGLNGTELGAISTNAGEEFHRFTLTNLTQDIDGFNVFQIWGTDAGNGEIRLVEVYRNPANVSIGADVSSVSWGNLETDVDISGSSEPGEAIIFGFDGDGNPDRTVDAEVPWEGSKISIPRDQFASIGDFTLATSEASRKGWILFDTAKSSQFTVSGDSVDVVLGFKNQNTGQWSYDNNSGTTEFTPDNNTVALGIIETDSGGDDIKFGSLFGFPRPLDQLPEWGSTVGAPLGTKVGGIDAGLVSSIVVFRETFEGYADGAEFEAAWSKTGTTTGTATIESEGIFGPNALKITGGAYQAAYGTGIPFNRNFFYRISVTAARTSGTSTADFGVAGLNGDRTTLENRNGADSIGTQHYFAKENADPSNVSTPLAEADYTEFVGYFQGSAATGSSESTDQNSPGSLHEDAKLFCPLIDIAGGTWFINEIAVEIIGTVDSSNIADDAISESKIGTDAVTTVKIATQSVTELVATFTATEVSHNTVGPHEIQTVSISSNNNNGGKVYLVATCSWGSDTTSNTRPLFEIEALEGGSPVGAVLSTNLNRLRSNPDAAHSAALTAIHDPTADVSLEYEFRVTLDSGETATFEDRSLAAFQAKDDA